MNVDQKIQNVPLINLIRERAIADSSAKENKEAALKGLKTEFKDTNNILWNIEDAKRLNMRIPGKYAFARANKASSDLGTIKKELIITANMGSNERFSYLSLLSEYRKQIEQYVGLSSKGIKINNVKLLIPRKDLANVDRYIAYKNIPVNENFSSSSKTGDEVLKEVLLVGGTPVEYSNMLFYSKEVGGVGTDVT